MGLMYIYRDVHDIINKGVSSTRSVTATNLMQLIIRQGPNQYVVLLTPQKYIY